MLFLLAQANLYFKASIRINTGLDSTVVHSIGASFPLFLAET